MEDSVFWGVGYGSVVVFLDGYLGFFDIDVDGVDWVFVCGGLRGFVCF